MTIKTVSLILLSISAMKKKMHPDQCTKKKRISEILTTSMIIEILSLKKNSSNCIFRRNKTYSIDQTPKLKEPDQSDDSHESDYFQESQ